MNAAFTLVNLKQFLPILFHARICVNQKQDQSAKNREFIKYKQKIKVSQQINANLDINMQELITISFGQAGIKIGDQTCSLYQQQHQLNSNQQIDSKDKHFLYEQTNEGKYISRSMAIDCDPYTLDELRLGPNKLMYRPSTLLCGGDSTGGIAPRGYNQTKKMQQSIEEQFQKILEKCDGLQGVMINFSMSGGAAGIVDRTLEILVGQNYLKKIPVISNALFPDVLKGNSVVEVYNYTILLSKLIEYSSLIIPYDNTSLYNMLNRTFDIDQSGFWQINHLIAQVQSIITLGMRNYGSLNSNFNQLITNMVPYPRIQMVYPTLAVDLQRINYGFSNVYNLTKDALKIENRMLDVDKNTDKIALGMFYRGNVELFQIKQTLEQLIEAGNSYLNFVDWVPTGYKISVNQGNSQPYFCHNLSSDFTSLKIPKSCLTLTNSHQFYDLLGKFNYKWDQLYAKRAFVYHFVSEGEQGLFFSEKREDLAALQKDYEQFGCEFCECDSDDLQEY